MQAKTEEEDEAGLEYRIFVINTTILTVFLICEVYVLIRIRCKLETKAIAYLATYTFCYMLRSLHDGLRLELDEN